MLMSNGCHFTYSLPDVFKSYSALAAGDLSRNRTVGLRIGKGETLQQIIDSMTAVAEGVLTSRCCARMHCLKAFSSCRLAAQSCCSG